VATREDREVVHALKAHVAFDGGWLALRRQPGFQAMKLANPMKP
jgi:hypothetical protein